MTSVGTYMTRSPVTIDIEEPLTAARRLMNEHHLHHLPVLRGADLVGVVSSRELEAFEVLPGSRHLTIDETMVSAIYVAAEDAPLDDVAEQMARRCVGSAIVVAGSDGSKVLGVFTAVDAMRALVDALRTRQEVVA